MAAKKIIVAGFGFMGMTHAMNILKHPETELAGIVDIHPEKVRENLNSRAGNISTGQISEKDIKGIKIYTDLGESIEVEKPDVCVIAVHTGLHYPLAKTALENGVHVFMEKPFTLNPEEGEELIALARDKNRLLMIGHVVRFMAPYLKLKQWIDTQEFGKLKFLSLGRYSGLPAWGEWKAKQADFGSTGGALFDLLIHDIDFAQWVAGKPESIAASVIPGKLSHYDYVSALWQYSGDLRVKIEGGNIFHSSFPFRAEFSASFEKASVNFSTTDAGYIAVATDAEMTKIPAGDAVDAYYAELDYFMDCINTGKQPVKCLPESALDTINICYDHLGKSRRRD